MNQSEHFGLNTSVCSVFTVLFKTLGSATGAQSDAVPLPERWSMEMDEVVSHLVSKLFPQEKWISITKTYQDNPERLGDAHKSKQAQPSDASTAVSTVVPLLPLLPH